MSTAKEVARAAIEKATHDDIAALHDQVALARLMYVRGWISVEQLEASLEEAFRRGAV